MSFSFSRILSAIGASLISLGTASGFTNFVAPKTALLIVALGGALNTFTERLQGGASIDPMRK